MQLFELFAFLSSGGEFVWGIEYSFLSFYLQQKKLPKVYRFFLKLLVQRGDKMYNQTQNKIHNLQMEDDT